MAQQLNERVQKASVDDRALVGVRLVLVAIVVVGLLIYGSGLVELPDFKKIVEDAGNKLGNWTYVLVGVMAFFETGAFVGLIAPGETWSARVPDGAQPTRMTPAAMSGGRPKTQLTNTAIAGMATYWAATPSSTFGSSEVRRRGCSAGGSAAAAAATSALSKAHRAARVTTWIGAFRSGWRAETFQPPNGNHRCGKRALRPSRSMRHSGGRPSCTRAITRSLRVGALNGGRSSTGTGAASSTA